MFSGASGSLLLSQDTITIERVNNATRAIANFFIIL